MSPEPDLLGEAPMVCGVSADVLDDRSDDDRRHLGALLSRLVDDVTAGPT